MRAPKNDMERTFEGFGVNVRRLLHWLSQPKQGIDPSVAMQIIREVYTEIKEGKRYWRDSTYYPENYREKLREGVFPEHFWIDNYILERCRILQDDVTFGSGNMSLDIMRLTEILEELAKGIALLQTMVIPIHKFLSIPPWMKRIRRWISSR